MRPLITPAELAELFAADSGVVLLDVRWSLDGPPGCQLYRQGHLRGAVYVDTDTELAAPRGDESVGAPDTAGRHPLPEPDALQRTLRAAGVRAELPVVVYDAADGSVAARAWWLLRWAGHPEIAVLDGGFAAWRDEGLPVSDAAPTPRPGDFTVRPGSLPTVDAAGAARLARDGVLLDARAAARYAGTTEPVDPRAGHIPGARNAPFAEHVDDRGRWRSPAELAERFRALGVAAGVPVGAYCGSGITACAVLLAMEHAGVADTPAALYPGSWSGWSADRRRPAATGEQPGEPREC